MFVCNLLWLDSLPAHGVPVKPAEQAQVYMFNPLVQSSLTKHGLEAHSSISVQIEYQRQWIKYKRLEK